MFLTDTLHELIKNLKCVDQVPHSNKELQGPDDYITRFSERLLIPLTFLFIESLSLNSWQTSRSEADVKLTLSMVAWNPFHVSFDVCKTTNLSLDSTTFDSTLGMTCTFMHCCTCLRLMSHLPGRRAFDSFSIQRNKASLLKRSTLQFSALAMAHAWRCIDQILQPCAWEIYSLTSRIGSLANNFFQGPIFHLALSDLDHDLHIWPCICS